MEPPFLFQLLQNKDRKEQRRSSSWLLLRRLVPPEMKTISTLYFHHVNTLKAVNCGSVTFFQHLQQSSMLCIFKMSSKKDFRRDKLERLVFAPFVKNSLPNASMNSSAKLLSNAQSAASCLLECVMK